MYICMYICKCIDIESLPLGLGLAIGSSLELLEDSGGGHLGQIDISSHFR